MFDPPTNEAEEESGPTVSYLYKLPKDFLKKVVPGISVEALTKVEKTQKGAFLHVLCRLCQLEVGSPVTTKKVDSFSDTLRERMKSVGGKAAI